MKKVIILVLFSLFLVPSVLSIQFYPPQKLDVDTDISDINTIVSKFKDNYWYIVYSRTDENYYYLAKFSEDLQTRLIGFNGFDYDLCGLVSRDVMEEYTVDIKFGVGNFTLVQPTFGNEYAYICFRNFSYDLYSYPCDLSNCYLICGYGCHVTKDDPYSYSIDTDKFFVFYWYGFWSRFNFTAFDYTDSFISFNKDLFIPADTTLVRRIRVVKSPTYNNYLVFFVGKIHPVDKQYIYVYYYNQTLDYQDRQEVISIENVTFPQVEVINNKIYLAYLINDTQFAISVLNQDSQTSLTIEATYIYSLPSIETLWFTYREDNGNLYVFFSNSTGIYYMTTTIPVTTTTTVPPIYPTFPPAPPPATGTPWFPWLPWRPAGVCRVCDPLQYKMTKGTVENFFNYLSRGFCIISNIISCHPESIYFFILVSFIIVLFIWKREEILGK